MHLVKKVYSTIRFMNDFVSWQFLVERCVKACMIWRCGQIVSLIPCPTMFQRHLANPEMEMTEWASWQRFESSLFFNTAFALSNLTINNSCTSQWGCSSWKQVMRLKKDARTDISSGLYTYTYFVRIHMCMYRIIYIYIYICT